jgi:hypothetical protein
MTGQGRGNRITTKDMEAIERIKGYCCEVTREQWKELVREAHNNGVSKSLQDTWDELYPVFFIDDESQQVDAYGSVILAKRHGIGLIPIPFPDFLAKLKGEEKWEPKAGEMVEVSYSGFDWCNRKFIGKNEEYYIVYRESDNTYWPYELNQIRPLTTTITRAEAESLLNKRIID